MSGRISRRDFLKTAGVGAAATALLSGCGPASRYVTRQPYTKMPEYTYNGLSTFYATTCRECPAGCGLVVRTMQGRALKVEGNPLNPVNQGKTCPRGQVALQGLYNPDRIQGPHKQGRGKAPAEAMTWDAAVETIRQALTSYQPGEVAFLLGLGSDHLSDLVREITNALGAPAPWRYGAFAMFEGRYTLAQAAQEILGEASLPYFDLGNADVVFSFGANFLETYISPVAYARGYAKMRKGNSTGKRGTLVQFEPRLSQTAAAADQWIPILPGTEGLAAMGIGRAAAELRGGPMPAAYQNVDLAKTAEATGVSPETYQKLAGLFTGATRPLAIPGGAALAASNGLESGKAILGLNVLANNVGQPGGILSTPSLPLQVTGSNLPNNFKDIQLLVNAMNNGTVKVLFIHGVNPFFEFPAGLKFTEACGKVSTIISFSSFPDETALKADYVFPDHTGLESWGYQRTMAGADRPVISGAQPVVSPLYDTHATADVLLAAVQAVGGALARVVSYKDVVEFMQHSVATLIQEAGYFNAADPAAFWAEWQQYGGWWKAEAGLFTPSGSNPPQALAISPPEYDGEGEFYLLPFMNSTLGDGTSANKPWLQETPDPNTTVMWGTWVEIHPETADELGLQDDDIVQITSPYGQIEASVYRYPAIRPDTVGIPFGQGHTAYGRYAKDRGANPAALLGIQINSAGDLATMTLKVTLTKTGKRHTVARMEGKMGVYGNYKVGE